MSKIDSTKDLIMLLLYARGHHGKQCEPIVSITRLMKMVFLFKNEIKKKFNLGKVISDDAFPNFEAYNYGPFTDQVYVDLEFLVDLGFLRVRRLDEVSEATEEASEYKYWQANSGVTEEDDENQGVREISLTKNGKDFVLQERLGNFTAEQVNALDKFKARCTGVSLKALLQYVYAKYPELAVKSKIRDKIF